MYCINDITHGESEKIGWKPSKGNPGMAVWINQCPVCKERWPEGYLILLADTEAGGYGPEVK